MSDDIAETPLRSGDRGLEFPELEAADSERIKGVFNNDNPFFPGYMGYRVLDLRRGYARMEVEGRQEINNPVGVMHGGASFGLADTAVAAALVTIYGSGKALLTVEMKINYLEPIFPGLVIAEAYVLRSSKGSAYAEVDVWAGGKLAARASTTYMIRPMPSNA